MNERYMTSEAGIRTVRRWIAEAERVVVLTGAGISTESGIPDFRGPKGVWTLNPGAEQKSTIDYYLAHSDHRKNSWQRLTAVVAAAKPNAGHKALVELERRGKLDLIVTQNTDGLHHAAGSSPERVIEVHGHRREVMCTQCDDRAPMERALDRVRAGEEDPPCRSCGGILKAAVIFFGESLVHADLMRAEEAAQRCDLLLAIGSTLGVYPANGVVPIAKQNGARIVILNDAATEMDELANAVIRGQIGEMLPLLCAADA